MDRVALHAALGSHGRHRWFSCMRTHVHAAALLMAARVLALLCRRLQEMILDTCIELIGGLVHLHDRNIIHGDLVRSHLVGGAMPLGTVAWLPPAR